MANKTKAKKKSPRVVVESFVRKGKGRWHLKGRKPKRFGQPVVAFRVDGGILAAFVRRHGGREEALGALRRHMAHAARKPSSAAPARRKPKAQPSAAA